MIGTTLSHYRITAQLGAGGMGEVYLAEDTKLERKVALKVLPAELADNPDRLKRLQREAKALAALDHPNIVTVFSVEEDQGIHFLTMAHVEGQGLDELLPEEGFSVDRLLELAVPLADALRAAHEHGIVHRDLKPGNIMVDREGRLRVLDFGLARREVAAGPEDVTQLATQTMTQAGTVMGTYPYMSPEQAQGQVADARSDLFSLGIILYEMATGRRPFTGETGVSLISSILKDAPAPITDVKAGLPEELGAIIERCLAKDPAERFGSAEELRERLEALCQEVVSGRAIVSATSGGVVTSQPRRTALVIALVVVAALAGVYGWMTFTRDGTPSDAAVSEAAEPRIASLAVLPLKNFSGDAEQQYFVDGMTEALITDLSKISALKVISRTSAMRYRDSDKTLTEIAEELDVEAVVEGSVLREGGRVGITAQLIEVATDQTLWADRYERDLTSVLALQGEIARAIAGEIQVTLTPQERSLLSSAREIDPEAHEAYLKGMFHLRRFTPQDFQTALQYFETALEIDPEYALAHYGVSQVWNYSFVLGIQQPRAAGPKALEAVTRALELDDSLAEAHLGLANIKTSYTWDWKGAEQAFLRAIEINPNYAEARVFYSHLLMILDRADEGRSQIERGLELDPLEPFFRAAYGVLLGYAGNPEQGIEVFRETYETTPGFGFGHQPFWRVLHSVGQLEEAMEHAKAHLVNVGEPEAVAAMERGEAQGGYREAMQQAADTLAAGSRLATARPIFIADLYDDAGNTEKALEWIERAYEIRDIDVAYLGVLLLSDEVRTDPRFLNLIEKLGVPLLERSSGAQARRISSLAVLPLANLSNDPEQEYFADGLTEALIMELSQMTSLKVISRTSVMRYKASSLSLPEIAAELGIDAIVEGSVQRADDLVQITLQLIEAKTDHHLWAQSFKREMKNILALQNDVAIAVAKEIGASLEPQSAQEAAPREVVPEAYELYLRRVSRWTFEGPAAVEAALHDLKRVMELDPEFAPAYAFLADLYGYWSMIGLMPDAEAYMEAQILARRALELDPSLAYAHAVLARLHFQYEWNWEAAEREFQSALESDSNNAFSLILYGAFKVLIFGDCDAGLSMMEQVLEHDPFGTVPLFDLGVYTFHCRRYDDSIGYWEKYFELVPGMRLAELLLAFNYEEKGWSERAANQCDRILANLGDDFDAMAIGACGRVYGRSGYRDRAQALSDRLDSPPKGMRIDPFWRAMACIGVGDRDCVFEEMNAAYARRSSNMVFLRVYPGWDDYRDDPRFQELMERMKFPGIAADSG